MAGNFGRARSKTLTLLGACLPDCTVRARFETQLEERGLQVDAVMEEFLGSEDDPDEFRQRVEEFWQRVATNVQVGRLRLLFVADQIPPELRRVVEFLNQQMNPAEVLAAACVVGSGRQRGFIRTLVLPRRSTAPAVCRLDLCQRGDLFLLVSVQAALR